MKIAVRVHDDGRLSASVDNGRVIVPMSSPVDVSTLRSKIERYATWEAREGRPVPTRVVVEQIQGGN